MRSFLTLEQSSALQSLEYAFRKNDRKTLLYKLLPGYVWLLCLPWIVSMGSILLGGWLVAVVVVQSHEAETMIDDEKVGHFVDAVPPFISVCHLVPSCFLREFINCLGVNQANKLTLPVSIKCHLTRFRSATNLQPQSYVETQFISTIDIVCPDPITEFWFGGMQYQLTHHLFPTLPRYDLPHLQPVQLCPFHRFALSLLDADACSISSATGTSTESSSP